jgi:hypothetical protein
LLGKGVQRKQRSISREAWMFTLMNGGVLYFMNGFKKEVKKLCSLSEVKDMS